jgi:nucleoside 2-deoxyribosyltransferase
MTRKMRALVLSPKSSSDEPIRRPLEEAFQEASVDAVSVGESPARGVHAANELSEAMRQADVIVADVSTPSPAVFYELGIATSLGKPTVILLSTHATGDLPFDIASYNIVTYDPTNPSALKRQMSRFLSYQASKLIE